MKSSIVETVKLPSLGKLDGIDPEVTIRSMTTFEEKLRLGSKGRFFKIISGIINRCITSPENFNSYDLTLQDFVYLFYQLRIVSYGSMYKVVTHCSECGSKFTDEVDLSKLEVNYLSDEFKNPFEITLPRSQDKVMIRLLRTREIDEIAKESEILVKNNKDIEGDPSYLISLARKIVSVNGKELPGAVLDKYVQDMEAIDSNYIEHKYDQVNFGLDITVKCICPKCGERIEYLLPVGDNFFRPQFDD